MNTVFNNKGSTGNGTAITSNGSFCAITVPEAASADQSVGQNAGPLISGASYLIAAGSTGVGTVVTFQELGEDGNWRSLASPAPITLADSGTYNAAIAGQFHGLQIAVSSLVGNGILYAELKGVVTN